MDKHVTPQIAHEEQLDWVQQMNPIPLFPNCAPLILGPTRSGKSRLAENILVVAPTSNQTTDNNIARSIHDE